MEIQRYILHLAYCPHNIHDLNRSIGRDQVHQDLFSYHKLKEKWELGHIKIKLSNCAKKFPCIGRPIRILHKNMINKHTLVLGHYVDQDGVERWAFLGYTLKESHHRLWYVKNFSI